MKKLILLALILAMALVLFACSETNEEDNAVYSLCDGVTFVKVVERGDFDIYVHEETGVMYISEYGQHQSGLTVMLDANGKPLIWEGEV